MKKAQWEDLTPYPHFQSTMSVPPALFVNRTKELEVIRNTVFRDCANVLVTGPRAIGKSSLLMKFLDELKSNPSAGIYPVWLDMQCFFDGDLNDFLNEILERVCCRIWTGIFGRKYSDLYNQASKYGEDDLLKSETEKKLVQVYRIANSRHAQARKKHATEAGATLVASAKKSEETQRSHELQRVRGYQFLHLLEELKDLLSVKGYHSILMLCDEANRLSENINNDILLRYFEIFASRKVLFAFVSVPIVSDLYPAFGAHVQLGAFPSVSCVTELISLVFQDFESRGGKPIPFDDICHKRIFDICEGHPRWIQTLCDKVYKVAQESKIDRIGLKVVESCAIDFLKMMRDTHGLW